VVYTLPQHFKGYHFRLFSFATETTESFVDFNHLKFSDEILQEWMEDLDNPDDKHRHISHMYGLHPSNQISPYSSPELFEAARTTLKHRGDVSTAWSMG
jgi:hypothetical protein